jgi:hypothetical protein
LGAVIVTLTILWLVAIWFLFLDPQTFLQKWQGGLWNSANWPVPAIGAGYQLPASTSG